MIHRLSFLLLFSLVSCQAAPVAQNNGPIPAPDWKLHETGKASWYGKNLNGCKTANGGRYNQQAMTAAHKKLPFGTAVRVTNVKDGRSCIVVINDRGPFIKGRVIDLSAAAAKQVGVYTAGIVPVRLEVMKQG